MGYFNTLQAVAVYYGPTEAADRRNIINNNEKLNPSEKAELGANKGHISKAHQILSNKSKIANPSQKAIDRKFLAQTRWRIKRWVPNYELKLSRSA